jgi:hypothetical protein
VKKSVFAFVTLFVLTFIAQISIAGVESLVLYMTFDEGAGDVVKDLSGKGNDGTVKNTKWVDGKIGKALEFSGSSYVDIPNSDSLSMEQAVTVMAWVSMKSGTSGEMAIVSKGQWAANDLPYELTITPGATIFWQFYDAAGRDSCRPPSPPAGEWHHIAGTYDGVTFTCYIDGVMAMQAVYNGKLPQNTASVTVGKRSKTNDCYFNGTIDEVAIFSSALSEEEVNSVMNGINLSVDAKEKLPVLWGKIKAE